jgi:Zn-dependent protease with chaperone function
MDFFAHQDAARKTSRRLTILFVLAVIGVVIAVDLLVWIAMGKMDMAVIGMVTLITTLAILGGSGIKIAMLREGGSAVAEMMGGRRVLPSTTEPQEKQLLNVVEEMAIASGVPVPAVFVMEHESGVNAFAAGYSPNDAAIAVTYGLLESMNRDELQGVIGHEFSHVLNGDMRLNLRMVGLLFGIEMVGHGGRIFFHIARGSDVRAALPLFAFGGALLAIGSIGLLAANLIRAAVSRQREYLADASAVQFTRNPEGIGSALIRIATESGVVDHPATAEVSHMFIAAALESRMSGPWATHPPLEDRIKRLLGPSAKERLRQAAEAYDRGGDDNDEEYEESEGNEEAERPATLQRPQAQHAAMAGMAGMVAAAQAAAAAHAPASALPGGGGTIVVGADQVVASVGNPESHHVDYAKALIASFPEPIRIGLGHLDGAKGIIIALLATDAKPEANIGAIVAGAGESAALAVARTVIGTFRNQNQHLRLPIVSLALPTLRAVPRENRLQFADLVRKIVAADGRITPFEFALSVMLTRALDDTANPGQIVKFQTLAPLRDDIANVLSLFVRVASEGSVFFDKLMKDLALEGATLLPPTAIKMDEVERSLGRIARLAPLKKPQFIKACLAAVTADGRITVRKAELMRAVAAALDSPLPPIIDKEVMIALAAATKAAAPATPQPAKAPAAPKAPEPPAGLSIVMDDTPATPAATPEETAKH